MTEPIKVLDRQPLCFAIGVAALSRWDVGYSASMGAFDQHAAPRIRLGELLVEARYGTSVRTNSQKLGTPILRMANIKDGGWDLRDLKYLQLGPGDLERYRLWPGDVLVNRTNTEELVGKAAVWWQEGEWAFASYLIRLRVRADLISPAFLGTWLNSADARRQIDRVSRRSAGQTNINAKDIRALEIPLVPRDIQDRMATDLDEARLKSEQNRRVAKQKLLEATKDVARLLQLEKGDEEHHLYSVTSLGKLSTSRRLDCDYYHPDRAIAKGIVSNGSSVRLGDVAVIRRSRSGASAEALGLGAVESGTGRRAPGVGPEAMSDSIKFEKSDVLVGRLRPALNKVWEADDSGYCSPEFAVLNIEPSISPAYIAAVLRCWFSLDQLKWAATGNTHPRLPDEDLLDLNIPDREPGLQKHIGNMTSALQREARRLEQQADANWAEARADFDRLLRNRLDDH